MTNIATVTIIGGSVISGCLLGQAVSGATTVPIADALKLGVGAVGIALWIKNMNSRTERRHAKRLDKIDSSLLLLSASIDGLPCHAKQQDCTMGTSNRMLNKVKQLLEEEPTTTKQ